MPSTKRRYVALLRGINVGGNNRVSMAQLRELCAGFGATNVRTYIASGNVVLDSKLSPARLRTRLEHGIESEFGISIAVVVLTAAELAAAIEGNPYPDAEPGTLHLAVALADIVAADQHRLAALDFPPEELTVVGRRIYYHLPLGLGNAQLPKDVDRIKVKTTTRNWRTVLALNEMAASSIDE